MDKRALLLFIFLLISSLYDIQVKKGRAMGADGIIYELSSMRMICKCGGRSQRMAASDDDEQV